ncbi:isochorismate synthase [Ectothiorhodospira shaposhnikovii]|uniref:isochorismate synthase n=1 Tax=Ectothiorhodospira shaposhnikovii TaxID=1054 RepID=UPI001EE93975|nr:isochorismate synthase [Ectothiorhodospira shaposhnikovii]
MSSVSQYPVSLDQPLGTGTPGVGRDAGGDCLDTGGPLHGAVETLLGRIKNWSFRSDHLLHLSVPVPRTNPFRWLQAAPAGERSLWQNREGDESIAGIGIAAALSAREATAYPALLRRIHDILDGQATAFIGGFSFDGQAGKDDWEGFPAARFVLPAVELRRQGGQCRLGVNLLADSRRDFMTRKTRLIAALCRLRQTPADGLPRASVRITRRVDHMDFDTCSRHIGNILNHIAQGPIRKVVLARRVDLQLNESPPAFLTLERWHRSNPGSFCFAIENGERLFMGCSPERLFSRSGRHVFTESLAGTVRRGGTAQEDAALERVLLQDPKLIHEHELVTRYVREQIAPWITQIEGPAQAQAGVFKLDRIQHRYLPIHATLREDVRDEQLLAALHPTPAVCGFPRGEARDLISRQETARRGWYSGVIGRICPQRSEFAVAIRSTLLHRNQALCYSGVGIVEGSDPAAEWNELEAKIESFLAVLES